MIIHLSELIRKEGHEHAEHLIRDRRSQVLDVFDPSLLSDDEVRRSYQVNTYITARR